MGGYGNMGTYRDMGMYGDMERYGDMGMYGDMRIYGDVWGHGAVWGRMGTYGHSAIPPPAAGGRCGYRDGPRAVAVRRVMAREALAGDVPRVPAVLPPAQEHGPTGGIGGEGG